MSLTRTRRPTLRNAACILTVLALAGCLLGMATMAHASVTLPQHNLSCFTSAQWSGAFSIATQLPLAQRIAFWGDWAAVDSVYVADPLGEGPGQTPDADPLCDYARVDCVTFVEQVYALALAPNAGAVPDIQRRIRYRDGQIDFRWRNHYTVSDWLPANAWFITDVTPQIGGKHRAMMTKTISRATFFATKGLAQYTDIPDETATTAYIPRAKVKAVADTLRTGDLAIFVIETPGIIAGHTGIIRMRDGVPYLQHASLSAKAVVTVPLLDYLKSAPPRFLGCKFARPYPPTPAP